MIPGAETFAETVDLAGWWLMVPIGLGFLGAVSSRPGWEVAGFLALPAVAWGLMSGGWPWADAVMAGIGVTCAVHILGGLDRWLP